MERNIRTILRYSSQKFTMQAQANLVMEKRLALAQLFEGQMVGPAVQSRIRAEYSLVYSSWQNV